MHPTHAFPRWRCLIALVMWASLASGSIAMASDLHVIDPDSSAAREPPYAAATALVPVDPVRVDPDIATDDFGVALDLDALTDLRGGENFVDNHILVDGLVDGNHAENILSGANTIGGEAFGNASGINTVIQNSGSNVLVQNAMIVNVQFGVPSP